MRSALYAQITTETIGVCGRKRRAGAVQRYERQELPGAQHPDSQQSGRRRWPHRRRHYARGAEAEGAGHQLILPGKLLAEFEHDRPRLSEIMQTDDVISKFGG